MRVHADPGGRDTSAGNARGRRTRTAILATTRSLVEERGFETITMATVAEQVGVSRRAIYLHFASRTELLVAVFDYLGEHEDLAGSLRPIWAAPDAEQALDEWARHLSRFHIDVFAVSRAIERASHADELAAKLWRTIMDNWRWHNGRLARWLAAEDRLASEWTVATATDMLCALMTFESVQLLVVDRRWSRTKYADHLAIVARATFLRP